MSIEKKYTGIKEMSGMLKTMFRNQAVFVARAAKQTDQKANMLISLGFYILIGIIFIFYNYDTFIHFSSWFLVLPGSLIFLCILECIYIVAPNTRILKKIFTEELIPEYPRKEFHNMYDAFPGKLLEKEESINAMVNDHALQLGNIIRGHYVSTRYISSKYKHLDRAYNYFLATLSTSLLLFILNLLLSGGHFQEHNERSSYSDFKFDEPSSIFVLDEKLTEISGLGFNSEENTIYTINDEEGKVYILNPKNGNILDHYKFAKKGDYEGIELINNEVLVTNSSGDIYISNFQENKAIIQHTPLSKINDVEGMGYDVESDQILLACKGEPWLPIKGDKGIFAYNQTFHRMDSIVFLDIKISDLISCVDTTYTDELMKKSLGRRLKEFAPSAIAIDPTNQDIYILTAHGSIIAVFDKNKKIRDIVHLNELIIPQPEGLCFDNLNNLFISTEGHGGSAKLFMYEKK